MRSAISPVSTFAKPQTRPVGTTRDPLSKLQVYRLLHAGLVAIFEIRKISVPPKVTIDPAGGILQIAPGHSKVVTCTAHEGSDPISFQFRKVCFTVAFVDLVTKEIGKCSSGYRAGMKS